MKSIAFIRQEYQHEGLDESQLSSDPFALFENWFQYALAQKVVEPNAMVLSTIDTEGYLASRVVLLKDFDAQGFYFFTNLQSAKAQQIKQNPRGALNFYWPTLARQITISGIIEGIDETRSDEYFKLRPRGAQIAAWASEQSMIVESRATLEANYHQKEKLFVDIPEIPRPPYWGGLCVRPKKIEFWQGRFNRLHDRILYTQNNINQWGWVRLSP